MKKTLILVLTFLVLLLVQRTYAAARDANRPGVLYHGKEVGTQRLLVTWKNPPIAGSAGTLAANPSASELTWVNKLRMLPSVPSVGVVEITAERSFLAGKSSLQANELVDATAEIEARIEELRKTGLFATVEPDYVVQHCALPSDEAFVDGRLWGLRNTGQSGGVSGADIEVVPAWEQTTGSANVVVAIIDTGIRYTHRDLAANMWKNPGEIAGDGKDNDKNGYVDDVYGIDAFAGDADPMDENGHGTHCAGTIGAVANDSNPHVGVAWNVKLMALRFLGPDGRGYISDSIECIDYAISKGATILSNSWGGGGFSSALESAIDRARKAGILFVAAAGNEGANNDVEPQYPSSYDVENVISVAALDRADHMASFSNYGASSVDLGAPGVSIYSSVASSDTAYEFYNGTSMATPHVSGVAALIRARFPTITLSELRTRILGNTRPVAALNGFSVTGGAVSAVRALGGSTVGELAMALTSRPFPLRAGQPAQLMATVTRAGQAVGGAAVAGTFNGKNLAFLDNGQSPDALSGDGVYTAAATAPDVTGSFPLAVTASSSGQSVQATTNLAVDMAAPSNDNFSNAVDIGTQTRRLTGSNLGAGAEAGEPAHAGTSAYRSVWWKWRPGTSGNATLTTFDSRFDSVLAVYTGTSLASLQQVAANDNAGGTYQSSVTFSAAANTTYYIAVDGFTGATGNIILNIQPPGTTPNQPPGFSRSPSNQSAVEGNTATFSVDVTGFPAPSLKWRKNGVDLVDGGRISGAGTANLQITNVSAPDSGSYDCVAANAGGTATSDSAFLFVEGAAVRPPNDNFSDRITIATTAGVSGSNTNASRESGEPAHAGASGSHSVWWTWHASSAGPVTIATTNSSFDTALGVYLGSSVQKLTQVAANNDNGDSRQSLVRFQAVANRDYQIAVTGIGSETGRIQLSVVQDLSGGVGGNYPSTEVPRPIPENASTVSSLTISGAGDSFSPASILVSLDISHTYRNDLVVRLIAPGGEVIVIQSRSGGPADNLVINGKALTAEGFAWSPPASINPNGTWKLELSDAAYGDTGVLNGWGLRLLGNGSPGDPTLPPPAESEAIDFEASDLPLPISSQGAATSEIAVNQQPPNIAASEVKISVDLEHTNTGNLGLQLISPEGVKFVVYGGQQKNQSRLVLEDQKLGSSSKRLNPNGTWKLVAKNRPAGGSGSLLSWTLKFPEFSTPTISVSDPQIDQATKVAKVYSFQGSASDDKGISRVEWKPATEKKWQAVRLDKKFGNWTQKVSLKKSGIYTFEFRAVDADGLISPTGLVTITLE